jgi:signal transduction histidine kinase
MVIALSACLIREYDQRKKAESLARFHTDQLSTLSHELRTPLTLIKLSIELLSQKASDEQKPYLDKINRHAQTTIELAENLLVHARIEAGQFQVQRTTFDLTELVLGTVQDLRGISACPLVLDCPNVPLLVFADQLLIRQVLTNLVNNAVWASNERPVVVRVSRREHDILISVSDDGAGMSQAERAKLFKKFSTSRPLKKGTGLGLGITREIVELHGGKLFVDTVPHLGTTMLLNIPLEANA